MTLKNSMRVYKRSGNASNQEMCRNKQGIMVGDKNEVLEVWADYFMELLNPQINVPILEENNYFGPECTIEVPTLQEILGIIMNLKNNRAPGEDSITAESYG
jgi:hypothetical protein